MLLDVFELVLLEVFELEVLELVLLDVLLEVFELVLLDVLLEVFELVFVEVFELVFVEVLELDVLLLELDEPCEQDWPFAMTDVEVVTCSCLLCTRPLPWPCALPDIVVVTTVVEPQVDVTTVCSDFVGVQLCVE